MEHTGLWDIKGSEEYMLPSKIDQMKASHKTGSDAFLPWNASFQMQPKAALHCACALVGGAINRPRVAQAVEINVFHSTALSASCVKDA